MYACMYVFSVKSLNIVNHLAIILNNWLRNRSNPEEFLVCVSLRIHAIHMRVYKYEIDYGNKIHKK